jgi:hypothetical protein
MPLFEDTVFDVLAEKWWPKWWCGLLEAKCFVEFLNNAGLANARGGSKQHKGRTIGNFPVLHFLKTAA